MPFPMGDNIQSVVVQGKLYAGGGSAGPHNESSYIVMEYDISLGVWATLPPYIAWSFAMAVVNNQLVLVGGINHAGYSKTLGVWRADCKAWTHPYPEMRTARHDCSVVVYKEWLVVAGGVAGKSHVEVLNTGSKQWYTGPPLPISWLIMKTVVVGDIGYFMGGIDNKGLPINKVYCVCIETLVSHITSKASNATDRQMWKEIPGLQLAWFTPLSISGSFLVVGGKDENREATTAIHLYQHTTRKWVKVGDLPSPRYSCTCAMITDRELLVTGGLEKPRKWLKKVHLAVVN